MRRRRGGVSPVLCISDMASASIITKSRPLWVCKYFQDVSPSSHPGSWDWDTALQCFTPPSVPPPRLSLPFPPLSFILSAFSPWFPAPHWILGEPSHRLLLFLASLLLLASSPPPPLLGSFSGHALGVTESSLCETECHLRWPRNDNSRWTLDVW